MRKSVPKHGFDHLDALLSQLRIQRIAVAGWR